MADVAIAVTNKPVWVDLSTKDPAAAQAFYAKLFGWDIEVNQDPLYGGYARARTAGLDVAGIGGTMAPEQPTVWNLYIGTDDAEDLGRRVGAAGGTVVMPAFDVGDQGRMAVFQDPSGAFISAWQTTSMAGFQASGTNAYGWAELNVRGIEKDLPFYRDVFGWSAKSTGNDETPYTEFQLDGESIGGALEMSAMAPAEMPNYWMIYFNVDDVDRAYATAVEAGGQGMLAPQDFPGGRFAFVSDPQGAMFGLLKMAPRPA